MIFCAWCEDREDCPNCHGWHEAAFHTLGLIGIAVTMALLVDALQDALSYVPPYFRDKWGQDNILTALGQFVPPRNDP